MHDIDNLKEQVNKLIAEGLTEEALDSLSKHTDLLPKRARRSLILCLSNFNRASQSRIDNQLTAEAFEVKISQISNSVLEILDLLEEPSKPLSGPEAASKEAKKVVQEVEPISSAKAPQSISTRVISQSRISDQPDSGMSEDELLAYKQRQLADSLSLRFIKELEADNITAAADYLSKLKGLGLVLNQEGKEAELVLLYKQDKCIEALKLYDELMMNYSNISDKIKGMYLDLEDCAKKKEQLEYPDYGLSLVFVEGGSFEMWNDEGSDSGKHQVSLDDFFISKYPVTVGQYRQYCKANKVEMPSEPDWGWSDNDPVVHVNHQDAQSYCNWLATAIGREVRLLAEAEWEYAARGGKKTKGYAYSGSDNISKVAWYDGNSGGKVHKVGSKSPNELGIYDMSGNVWEWSLEGVLRGGSENSFASYCRVVFRFDYVLDSRHFNLGFRVALPQ